MNSNTRSDILVSCNRFLLVLEHREWAVEEGTRGPKSIGFEVVMLGSCSFCCPILTQVRVFQQQSHTNKDKN